MAIMIRKAGSDNKQLMERTWPRRLVFPTPEFPMITTLTVRMNKRCQQETCVRTSSPKSKFCCAAGRGRQSRCSAATKRRADCHCLLRAAIPMNSDNATAQTNPAEPPLVPNHQLPPSENKLFRKWRREFSLITGYGIDPTERLFTINRHNCERWKKDMLNYSASFLPIGFFLFVAHE